MALILVIDDNNTNLTLFRHLLKKMGDIETQCFENPIDALEWCKLNTPDLVLLDYMMPEMNGLDFISTFRIVENYKDIPLIMITADTESDIRYRALELGAHDFITKPVDKTELIARVRNLLALRESQMALSHRAEWLATEIKKATSELRAREKEMVLRLSKAAEHRDPETGRHLLRMARYSQLIARELELSEAEQELILEAAPMHDIGKVATPDAILLKRGKLLEDEFTIMKQHSEIGFNILRDSSSLLMRTAAIIALNHHEKFNGNGYPYALKGEDIPLYARIVAVADVFDALTSSRPYKRAWSLEDAVQFLKNQSGIYFDPKCVDAFLNAWDDVLEIHTIYKDDEIIDIDQL